MKYTICCLSGLTLMLGIHSCKKEKGMAVQPVYHTDSAYVIPFPDYMAMKPGNYWIYESYQLDTVGGAAHSLGYFDSCFIANDTIINGKTYHTFIETQSPHPSYFDTSYVRDSLSYVVNNYGNIVFSSTNFTDTFRTIISYPGPAHLDTIVITEQMGLRDAIVTVPVGSFTTYSFRQVLHLPPSLPYGPTREYDYMYAKGVGCVKKTTAIYTVWPKVSEDWLIRYHVQ